MREVDLGGVFVPLTTPFEPDTAEVDRDGFRSNLEAVLAHPIRGVVVSGSTGEGVLLDEEERSVLLHIARQAMTDDRLLVAGTGAESTRATIRLTRRAADAGADAVLVQPPAFYREAMSASALREHYRAVAEASPVPVILYQVPLKLSTIELDSGLVMELSSHPNVVGIKDSRGSLELLGALVEGTTPGFQVLAGNGAQLFGSLAVGAVGGILATANLVPGEAANIVARYTEGSSEEAGRLQEKIAPIHRHIVGTLGIPGMKRALDLLGRVGGRPRPPLHPLPDKDEAGLRRTLEAAGLLP